MSWDIQALFRQHADGISQSLRKGGLPPDMAADLTQDTFLRVIVSPPADTAQRFNPAAYLYRIARNLRIDHQRRERLSGLAHLTDDQFAAIAQPMPCPEAALAAREKLALLRDTLAELPERQQRAFVLHRLGEMTLAEVATRLGISTSTAWALIRDAYEHIHIRLGGH